MCVLPACVCFGRVSKPYTADEHRSDLSPMFANMYRRGSLKGASDTNTNTNITNSTSPQKQVGAPQKSKKPKGKIKFSVDTKVM